MRKIVVMRPREWLRASAGGQLTAADVDDRVSIEGRTAGVRILPTSQAVAIPPTFADRTLVEAVTFGKGTGLPHSYAVAADFESDAVEREFVERNPELVEGVFADPLIAPFPVVCPGGSVGTQADVITATNIGVAHTAGHKGTGTRLVIVDTGVDGSQVNVAGGWTLFPGVAPGTAAPDHGTMVAWDALLMAPNAAIWDCPLLKSTGAGFVAFLSDAIRAYGQILATMLQTPGVWVLVNSWGMYDRSFDAPIGNPQNYARNPRHPFNQIVSAMVGSGADVVFAAGNCGATCPSGRCGVGDVGPANSIHGANSHPEVISVAAVTVLRDRLGYSSQGPGGLSAQTPDVAAPSHFDGAGIVFPVHTGTSAACPVAAGIVASLRSKSPAARALTPAQMKANLLATASQPTGVPTGWNADYGHGIVDAGSAWKVTP